MQSRMQLAAAPGAGHATDEVELGALGRAVWRRKAVILTLTLIAAALAFFAVNTVTPRYKSEARVMIETRDNIFLRPDAEKSLDRGATVDAEAVTSQVQLILSRDLARDVIKKLKLGDLPEFDPVLRGTSTVRVVLNTIGLTKDPINETPDERVLRSYFEKLSAYQVEKSRVIAIEFDSQDPELAATVANTVADTYLVMQQAAKLDQSRSAGNWLAGEIEKMRSRVADAEAKVEQYRSTTNLFIGNNNTSLSNQQLGDSSAQFSTARTAKSDAEAKARIIRDTLRSGAPIEFSDVINSELMRRLSEQRVTLRAQLAEQSSTLLPRHPRIKELRAQIADLETAMRAEADRLARSFENDARLAAARADSLSASLDALKRAAASTNEQDVQLRALERDAKSQRDLLESYLAKYREAAARDNLGAASPDARVISGAVVSNTPSWPKKLPTVLVAMLGTFVLSVGFVLTGELLGGEPAAPVVFAPVRIAAARAFERNAEDDVAATPERLEAASVAPLPTKFVSAAAAESEPSRVAETREFSPAPHEAIEKVARDLRAAGEGARRITVLAVRPNLATTATAITLARSLSRQGRVVLVDMAFASPNLSVIAADPSAPGVSELVQGSASIGQIITRDRHSRVHLITAGRAPANADTVFDSQRLAITLEALAHSYDHVVIEAGALPEIMVERFAQIAPRAALIVDSLDDPAIVAARQRLLAAGFTGVNVLASTPAGPVSSGERNQSAA